MGVAGTLSADERLRELAWLFDVEEIAAAAGVSPELIERHLRGEVTAGCDPIRRAWCALMPPDVDEVAVERVLDGDRPGRLTVAERREAVRRLVLSGRSLNEIAERVGVGQRTACRIVGVLDVTRPTLMAEGSRMGFRNSVVRRAPWMDGDSFG